MRKLAPKKQYKNGVLGSGKTGKVLKRGPVRSGPEGKYKPEFVEQAKTLCQLGATDMELSEFFGVTWRTIYYWRNAHADFGKAMEAGKEAADDRVARSLYLRAVGYEHDAVKIFPPTAKLDRKNGKWVKLTADKVPYVAHVPPDITAAIFWLKNRRPQDWRDRQSLQVGGDPDGVAIEMKDASREQFFSAISRIAAALPKSGTDEDPK